MRGITMTRRRGRFGAEVSAGMCRKDRHLIVYQEDVQAAERGSVTESSKLPLGLKTPAVALLLTIHMRRIGATWDS